MSQRRRPGKGKIRQKDTRHDGGRRQTEEQNKTTRQDKKTKRHKTKTEGKRQKTQNETKSRLQNITQHNTRHGNTGHD